MVIDTKKSLPLFFKIFLLLFVSFLLNSHVFAQLRMELNFGEENNYILFDNAYNSPDPSKTRLSELFQNGDFEVSGLTERSPSGDNFLVLNGINYFLKTPGNANINLNGHVSYSVSMWIYLYSSGINGEIINADNGFVSGYRLFLENNVPKLEIREGIQEIFSSEKTLPSSQWTHIGFYCDGVNDSVTFFVDGNIASESAFTKITQVNTGANSYIGAAVRSSPPNFLKANLDQIRFFAGRDTIFDYVQHLQIASKSKSRKNKPDIPQYFTLLQNYPNPFNASTKISFILEKSGYVELKIYDLLGNTVRTLYDGVKEEGTHELYWDGMDFKSITVPSGIYFMRLSFNGSVQTKKMILVK
ncbi:T9SS type A sorting domain-containing protein [bacterium]|nr:MAG: T9SS type A sorting domain-containing protein [bacterium]